MRDASGFFDDPLSEERIRAKDMCFDYNRLRPSDKENRRSMVRELFGKIGKTFQIQQPFMCDYGYNIKAGENLFINHNCIILDTAEVTIGDDVLIGPNCGIYAASHPLEAERRFSEDRSEPIVIGSDVWIGGNTIILSGVEIGDNVVIGAGSVVNKDIPTNTVAVGNPCRVIRRI